MLQLASHVTTGTVTLKMSRMTQCTIVDGVFGTPPLFSTFLIDCLITHQFLRKLSGMYLHAFKSSLLFSLKKKIEYRVSPVWREVHKIVTLDVTCRGLPHRSAKFCATMTRNRSRKTGSSMKPVPKQPKYAPKAGLYMSIKSVAEAHQVRGRALCFIGLGSRGCCVM